MKIVETLGVHTYLPPDAAKEFAGKPFGPDRLLTIFEEDDMLLVGKTRAEIADMTPEALAELADLTADVSPLLVGA